MAAAVFLPGSVTNYEPAQSPDSTKIAFTSEQGGVATIWAMDADGSNQTKLTYGYAHGSVWSPDGAKIFFINFPGQEAQNGIWVMDSNGSNQKRLFNIAGEYKYLAWSPDGTKMAFESEQQGNADIWVMESDGSNQINLTNSTTGDYDPAWSPDGTKIAFVSEPESRSFIEWWSATEEDTKVRVFGWSEQQGNTDIWVMDTDGSNQIRLTETEAWEDTQRGHQMAPRLPLHPIEMAMPKFMSWMAMAVTKQG